MQQQDCEWVRISCRVSVTVTAAQHEEKVEVEGRNCHLSLPEEEEKHDEEALPMTADMGTQ